MPDLYGASYVHTIFVAVPLACGHRNDDVELALR